MRYLPLLIICILSTAALQAQNQGKADLLQSFAESDDEQVQMYLDSLLVDNYYKLRIRNARIKGVPGYRIRIFSDSGLGAREEQQRVRARFLTLFPDIDAYPDYDELYFKVYVGDCRTRSEALKLYDQIEEEFPNPILVEDFINIQ